MSQERKPHFEQNVKDSFASDLNAGVDTLFANEHGHCFSVEFEGSIKVKRADFEKKAKDEKGK